MIVPMLAIAAALVTLSTLAARDIADALGTEVVSTTTSKAESEISSFIRVAEELSMFISSRVARGDLPADDLDTWRYPLLDQMHAFKEVSFIVFANAAGETIAAERDPAGLLIGVRNESTGGMMIESATTEEGVALDPPVRAFEFDPALRPWHRAALERNASTWTEPYLFAGRPGSGGDLGISYACPVRDSAGELLGVLAIDVTLGDLSRYLASLSISTQGAIFIVDRSGLLVAASEGGLAVAGGARLSLAGSPSAAAAAVAHSLPTGESGFLDLDRPLLRRVDVGDEPARALITPFRPSPGIDWWIVSVVPERVFMGQALTVQRRLIALSLVGIAFMLAIAFWLSQRLAVPILQLRAHVRRVGEGAVNERLNLRAAREFEDLSKDLNAMAGQLRQRLALQQSLEFARQVQQGLLPKRPPAPSGLDLAGNSQYCDSTGGDYFDFIDLAPAKGRDGADAALVAVGDVMGHGVASALLMASARAALRIQANEPGDLGMKLGAVNRVLMQDSTHGRFMTMLLLLLNPAARRVRYANAGHDAALLYDPATGQFRELEGGGLPLGVEEETKYEEFCVEDIPRGAVLVAGTDGIWETRNAAGESFGKSPLREQIRAHAHEPAQVIVDRIRAALQRHRGGRRLEDDVTLVVARFVDATAPDDAAPAR